MKIKTLLFFLSLAFISCEEAEVGIPLADQVMGNYTMNTFQTTNGSLSLPFTSSAGSEYSVRVVITKTTETTVDFNLITKTVEGGLSLSQPSISKGLQLSKTDSGIIEIKNTSDGSKVSEVNGSNISVYGSLEGESYTYLGSKDI